jgi:hypothetical protein
MSTSPLTISTEIFISGPNEIKFAKFSDVATVLVTLQTKEQLNDAYLEDFNIVQLIMLHSAALSRKADLTATVELIARLIIERQAEIVEQMSKILEPITCKIRYISSLIQFLATLPEPQKTSLVQDLITAIDSIPIADTLSSLERLGIEQTKASLVELLPETIPITATAMDTSSPLSDSGLFLKPFPNPSRAAPGR